LASTRKIISKDILLRVDDGRTAALLATAEMRYRRTIRWSIRNRLDTLAFRAWPPPP